MEIRKAQIEDLRQMGFEKFYLWVLGENVSAQKFYNRNGFFWNGDKLFSETAGKELIDFRFTRM